MVVVSLAATLPVNPASASPVLSHDDVWKGLIEKCLRPQTGFVKPILDCEVVKQDATEIVRDVTFDKAFVLREGREKVRERIDLVEGFSAIFYQDNGSKVTNMISRGQDGIHDLYLTFAFNWQHPEIEEGSEEIPKKQDEYRALSFKAIESTIQTIRHLKTEGKL